VDDMVRRQHREDPLRITRSHQRRRQSDRRRRVAPDRLRDDVRRRDAFADLRHGLCLHRAGDHKNVFRRHDRLHPVDRLREQRLGADNRQEVLGTGRAALGPETLTLAARDNDNEML